MSTPPPFIRRELARQVHFGVMPKTARIGSQTRLVVKPKSSPIAAKLNTDLVRKINRNVTRVFRGIRGESTSAPLPENALTAGRFKRYFVPRLHRTRALFSGPCHAYSPFLRATVPRDHYVLRRSHPKARGAVDRSEPARPSPEATNLRPGMLSDLHIVTTPTADTPGACLRLQFDKKHYMFGNISEGTQRIMSSKKMSMAKVENIFLTGLVDWHSTGGLLGFLLTMADVHGSMLQAKKENHKERLKKGKKPVPIDVIDHVNLHGGKNLTHVLATARNFVFRKSFPLRPHEITADGEPARLSPEQHDWEDNNIRVWYVPVESNGLAGAGSNRLLPSKKRRIDSISDAHVENDPVRTKPTADSGCPPTTSTTQEDIDQQMRLCLVRDMFAHKEAATDQAWNIDALTEVKTGGVNPGNSTFIRDENGDLEPYRPDSDATASTEVLVRKSYWRATDIPQIPPTEPAHMSMCYIVKLQAQRGKFDPDKALGLGIEKTQFKLLTGGKSVPGKNGMTVTPDMVMHPAPEAKGFAVVEIPDASYIEGFLTRSDWKTQTIMAGIEAMYWITRDPGLLDDERLLSFMREHSAMKHIVLSRSTDAGLSLIQGSAKETSRLTMIDDHLFPKVVRSDVNGSRGPVDDPSKPYQLGQVGAQLRLNPKVAFSTEHVVAPVTQDEVMERFTEDPEILRLAGEAKAKISDPAFLARMEEAAKDLPNPDTEVIPLGTGSALPSRSRNVSCTLIRVPGVGSYLLDCGENSLGQLRRMYGYEGADDVVKDLRAIWISHSHADHHLGTVSVIKRFFEVVPTSSSPKTQQRLAVIAHPIYHQFLSEYSSVELIGLDSHVCQISNDVPLEAASPINNFSRHTSVLDDQEILAPFGISRVQVCPVVHCNDARAVAITLTSGLKFAYSGDCRPSWCFADHVGHGAHLLVHEATLDDELSKDAVAKKHCTISEALDVARRMKAKNVLLTHFSQRYPKLPVIGDGALRDEFGQDTPVLFAFDFMRVTLGEFRRAREFLPALQRLYDDEEKAESKEEAARGLEDVEDKILVEKTADV